MGSVITVQSDELDGAEDAVILAACDYIALRDAQTKKFFYGGTGHSSAEGKALNAAVKKLEEVRHG